MTSAILNQGPEVERSGFHSKQAVVYNPKNLKRQVRTHMNKFPMSILFNLDKSANMELTGREGGKPEKFPARCRNWTLQGRILQLLPRILQGVRSHLCHSQ